MLIPLGRFRFAYELIHRQGLQPGCSVLIFVSPSVDALAACTVLVVSFCALAPFRARFAVRGRAGRLASARVSHDCPVPQHLPGGCSKRSRGALAA